MTRPVFRRSGAGSRSANARRAALAAGAVLVGLGLVGQASVPGAAAQNRGTPRASQALGSNAASAATPVPLGQTIGGAQYGVNPTSVESDVNSLDGALEIAHMDMRVAGIGVPFVLERQYNSRAVGLSGAFGPGWSSILDLAVRFSNHGRRAIVYGEDGQEVGFTYQAASRGWLRDSGVRASLSCSGPASGNVAPATCTVTRFSDGVNWTLSHGRVQNYLTAAGQGLKFGYTKGQITTVTVESTASKPLVVQFARDHAGRVTKLTTPTRSVHYSYDSAGDLSSVTDANGNVWRMTYASGHRLTQVAAYPSASSNSGVRILSASYDAHTGRVSAAVERIGSEMHNTSFGWKGTGESGQAYRYELQAVNGSLIRARYTDTYSNGELTKKQLPLGQTASFQYGGDMDLLKTTTPTGSTDTMTYDSSGDELSSDIKLDSSGNTESQTFTYDSHHRLISSSQPATDSVTDTTTNTYNSKGELTSTDTSGSGITSYVYNGQALPISSTDGAGNVTKYTYDAYGNSTGETVKDSSDGSEVDGLGPLFAYNESGQQVLSVPASANKGGGNYIAADATRTVYNPDGLETSLTTPGPATSTTSYDAAGEVASTTDPNGRATNYTWSQVSVKGGQEWEERTTDPAGTAIDVYDPSGDVLSSTPPQPARSVSGKPAGVVTDVYDANQQVSSSTNGQGVTTTYTRDALGNVVKSASRGVYTSATYNLVGWATSASTTTVSYPPDNGTPGNPQYHTSTTYTSYGLVGQVMQSTDAAGGSITYGYGPGDRISSVKDEHGITSYTYDPLGDVTSVTSPTGNVTSYTYNAQGHETSQSLGSQTWTMAYNADGNLVQSVDPDGRTTTLTYDAMNRKTSATYSWAAGASGPTAPPVTWSYDKLGDRTQMTDGAGTHTYTYDSQGRLVTADTVSPSGAQNFSYDYSTPGETTETYPDHTTVTYHTDDGGNLLGLSVPAQSDGSPAFKTGNMLPTTGVTQGATDVAAGVAPAAAATGTTAEQPSGTLYPDGLLAYTFTQPQTNAAGAATTASGTAFYTASMANSANSSNPDPPQGAYIAEADLNGNLLSERWLTVPASGASQGNEMTIDYGYNGGATDTSVVEGTDAGVELTSWSSTYNASNFQSNQSGSYVYDGDGNPTAITNNGTQGNWHWNFTYNDVGEINSVSTNAANPSNTNQSPVFSYDRAGNMTQAGGVANPVLTTSVSSAIQGNVASSTFGSTGNGFSDQWTFAYNDAGQLASANLDGSTRTVTFSYDGDGNLVSENDTNPGSTAQQISLIWDPRPASPQLAEANVNSTHERYFWGNGLAGMETGGKAYVMHDNQNGTPTMVTDTSGATVQESYYDPDGNFINSFSQLPTLSQPLIGFDGGYRDPVVGLDMVGGRWYDPDLGMFMSRKAPSAPTPGSSAVASQPSTATAGMSGSPGTSPLAPAPGTPSDYSIGGQDPTNQTDVGSSVVPSSSATGFKAFEQGAYSYGRTAIPYVFGTAREATTEALSQLHSLYKGLGKVTATQTPSAAAEAGAATEVASTGSTAAEDGVDLANAGNKVEEATQAVAKSGLLKTAGKVLGKVFLVGGMAFAAYETVETCGQYGSTSRECIGAAVGTAVSYTAQLACDALTAGAGSVPCGLLQSVLSTVIPLIIEGNGQAFLDSVTFSSGFNINDANVLAAQILISAALWPIGGPYILLGEVIYANWAPISNFLSTYGGKLLASLTDTGETILNGVEGLGSAAISGISTAGNYLASGVSQLANYLVTDGFQALANQFENLGSDISSVVDQFGSALCDFASSLSCFASDIFGKRPQRGQSRGAASAAAAAPPATGYSRSVARRGGHGSRIRRHGSRVRTASAQQLRRRPGHGPGLARPGRALRIVG